MGLGREGGANVPKNSSEYNFHGHGCSRRRGPALSIRTLKLLECDHSASPCAPRMVHNNSIWHACSQMIGRLNMFCEYLFEMFVGEVIWSQWEIAQMKIQIQIRGIFLPRALRNPVYDIKPRPAVITLIKTENWWERKNCEGSFFSSVTTKTNPNCEIHRS